MKTLRELLKKEVNTFNTAIEWVGDKTIEQVVNECNRGDLLLLLANDLKLNERKIIACAGHCVNTVRNLIELMEDERVSKCVDLCMKFEDESISFEELGKVREDVYKAWKDARDAGRDNSVANSAYFATLALEAAYSYSAVHFVARAAAYYFTNNYAATARKENELQTANIVRERLGQDIINKVNQLLNN